MKLWMDGNEIIAGELLVSVVGAVVGQPAVSVTCNNYGWLYASNTVDGACCPEKNKKIKLINYKAIP